MKQITAVLLVLCLCITLNACSGGFSDTEVQNADELILAIGDVSLDSESSILAAKAYYNTLTDKQQAMVENTTILESAIKTLDELKLEQLYLTAVSYEDIKSPLAAMQIYESLPPDYKDVAERIKRINSFLDFEGIWVCEDLYVAGSDGNIYSPQFSKFKIYATPVRYDSYGNEGWTCFCYGSVSTSASDPQMYLTPRDFWTGPVGPPYGVNDSDYYEFDLGGTFSLQFSGETWGRYYIKDQIIKVIYKGEFRKTDTKVTVEFIYHKVK